jgi:hypothetical protein
VGEADQAAPQKRTQLFAGGRMTSFRQIEANRRNARLSSGPVTEEGKKKSRQNALPHGLAAETVIGALEDAFGCIEALR